jgi:hypothetical protein
VSAPSRGYITEVTALHFQMGNSKLDDLNVGLVEAGASSSADAEEPPKKVLGKFSRLQWGLMISLAVATLAVGIAYGIVVPEIEDRVKVSKYKSLR